FVPGATWIGGLVGWFGFDAATGNFNPVPAGIDWFLIGAFAAFSGAGGVINISLSNWARDKGYGMGSVAGYIPSAIGGRRTDLAHTGFRIATDPVTMQRWKGWWRLVRADQYGVFFIGAVLGMLLPGLLYVTFVPSGEDIRGLAVASTLAHAVAGAKGAVFGGIIAMMAVWVLLKAQLDILEGTVRGITDILWAGSSRVRTWRGGDVRLVYYSVLGLLVAWGVIALRLAQPVVLLQISANVGGIVFVLASLHLLRINTTLLPPALRPPLWRRVALVTMALFYGAFVTLWLSSLRKRSGGTTEDQIAGPLWRALAVLRRIGLLGIGVPEQQPQPFDLTPIPLVFGLADRPLGQPGAENIDRVDPGHPGLPLAVPAPFGRQPVPIADQPGIQGRLVGDLGPQRQRDRIGRARIHLLDGPLFRLQDELREEGVELELIDDDALQLAAQLRDRVAQQVVGQGPGRLNAADLHFDGGDFRNADDDG
ncbi:MAG: Nramp family divalent metal transporter, partial [Gemmatimonadota bacterium]